VRSAAPAGVIVPVKAGVVASIRTTPRDPFPPTL
jgi:hypothetical protein